MVLPKAAHWEFLRAATMVALKAAMRAELKVVHSEQHLVVRMVLPKAAH